MPRELDEMVSAIKRSGGAKNPYAVARSRLGSDAKIKARRKGKTKAKPSGRRNTIIDD